MLLSRIGFEIAKERYVYTFTGIFDDGDWLMMFHRLAQNILYFCFFFYFASLLYILICFCVGLRGTSIEDFMGKVEQEYLYFLVLIPFFFLFPALRDFGL